MQWFRLYTEFATDPKVQMMSEAMQRRLIMLFCLRCGDVTVTLDETEIAFSLRINADELAETKKLFIAKNFIDSNWNIINWDKRQYASDSSAARTRAYRERKKRERVTSQVTNSDALEQNRTDTEQIQNNIVIPDGITRELLPVEVASLDKSPVPYSKIMKSWNKVFKDTAVRQVSKPTDQRCRAMRLRWFDSWGESLEVFESMLERVKKSNFCMGRKSGSDWIADFDWILRPDTSVRISEGKYDNKQEDMSWAQ